MQANQAILCRLQTRFVAGSYARPSETSRFIEFLEYQAGPRQLLPILLQDLKENQFLHVQRGEVASYLLQIVCSDDFGREVATRHLEIHNVLLQMALVDFTTPAVERLYHTYILLLTRSFMATRSLAVLESLLSLQHQFVCVYSSALDEYFSGDEFMRAVDAVLAESSAQMLDLASKQVTVLLQLLRARGVAVRIPDGFIAFALGERASASWKEYNLRMQTIAYVDESLAFCDYNPQTLVALGLNALCTYIDKPLENLFQAISENPGFWKGVRLVFQQCVMRDAAATQTAVYLPMMRRILDTMHEIFLHIDADTWKMIVLLKSLPAQRYGKEVLCQIFLEAPDAFFAAFREDEQWWALFRLI